MAEETQPLLKDILEEMRSGFARMEARFDIIDKRLTRFDRKFDVLTSDIVDVRERVGDLERKPN